MIMFRILDDRYDHEILGFVPEFFDELDTRKAADQLDANYQHGGGWRPMDGWKVGPVGELMYSGEPPLQAIAVATLHNEEIIRFYPHAWMTITQLDGSFQVSRVD